MKRKFLIEDTNIPTYKKLADAEDYLYNLGIRIETCGNQLFFQVDGKTFKLVDTESQYNPVEFPRQIDGYRFQIIEEGVED
jgi:hypothetical protein